jgi:hypothetical protein
MFFLIETQGFGFGLLNSFSGAMAVILSAWPVVTKIPRRMLDVATQ